MLGLTAQGQGETDVAAGLSLDEAFAQLAPLCGAPVPIARVPVEVAESGPLLCLTQNSVSFSLLKEEDEAPPLGHDAVSIEQLSILSRAAPARISPALQRLLPLIREHAIRIPYLNLGENEYIYRFRTDRERNRDVYRSDERGRALYQSALCAAVKALKRNKERSAVSPALLDFGCVRYLIPSHFGFCLGVQNAIERAYETIAGNPGRRVFMLSELIHNPFVNDDLIERGLQYLQNDKGKHLLNPATGREWWDDLTPDDIVIIPAFGATDADKRRLIEKGIPLNRHDATCMLVEKVWKAARRHAQDGFTILIHGKSEHEETKATFSNSAKFGPSLIVRDMKEMQQLGKVILEEDPDTARSIFMETFDGRASPSFDPARDLDRIAVVNQTTLLRNETLALIRHLEEVFSRKFGPEQVRDHLSQASKGDTLCYATQVNQDALGLALTGSGADHAVVIGGRNSSNTYQLFRMCAQHFGDHAHYIQSERDIPGPDRIRHTHFASEAKSSRQEFRAFLPADFQSRTQTLVLTGGASCPDGIIQQVINRLNGFFPPERLRPIEDVLADLGE
jgi:4-hydroxy-3-methylbut-2-en-1-yl diphosphate reductase